MLRVGNNKITTRKSTNTSNNSTQNPKKILIQRKFVPSDSESTSSEEAEAIYRYRKKTLRALSDYESDNNNIEIATSSLASSSTVNTKQRKVNKKTAFNTEHCFTNNQSYSSSSSDSEDSIIFQNPGRRKVLRQLSDYESGDSFDNAGESSLIASVNHSLVDSTNLNNDLHESSDEDSFYNTRRLRCKRPHFLSTSDSSDSEFPVRFPSSRKRPRIIASSDESDGETVHIAQSSRRRRTRTMSSTRRRFSSVRTRSQTRRQLRPRHQNHRVYVESEIEDDSSSTEVRRLSSRVIENGNNSLNRIVQMRNLMRGARNQRQPNRGGVSRNRRNESSEQSNNRPSAVDPIPDVFTEYQGRVPRHSGVVTLFFSRSETDNNYFTVSGRNSTLQPVQRYIDSSDSESSVPFRPRIRRSTVPIHDSDSDANNAQELSSLSSNPSTSCVDVTSMKADKINEKSSGSEAESDKCPICLSCFGYKEVASPESCDHLFCTACIQEWAKNNNTCPIDRKLFSKIMVRSSYNREVIREIPVEDPSSQTRTWQINTFFTNDEVGIAFPIIDVSSSEEDDICCICFTSSSSGDLILCDFCNNIYHMGCLNPPLRSVPVTDWYCPSCVEREFDSD